MSRFVTVKKSCCICGFESEQKELLSTSEFESSDLDMRPGNPRRSTMQHWVESCSNCGYVNEDIHEKAFLEKEMVYDIINSEPYKNCMNISFPSYIAEDFFRSAYIAKETLVRLPPKKLLFNKASISNECFNALQCCAWECDDYEDYKELAKRIRKLAIPYLINSIPDSRDKEERFTKILILADLYRRSEQYEKVVELLNKKRISRFSEPIHKSIALFQIEKAKQEDSGCYNLDDIEYEDDEENEESSSKKEKNIFYKFFKARADKKRYEETKKMFYQLYGFDDDNKDENESFQRIMLTEEAKSALIDLKRCESKNELGDANIWREILCDSLKKLGIKCKTDESSNYYDKIILDNTGKKIISENEYENQVLIWLYNRWKSRAGRKLRETLEQPHIETNCDDGEIKNGNEEYSKMCDETKWMNSNIADLNHRLLWFNDETQIVEKLAKLFHADDDASISKIKLFVSDMIALQGANVSECEDEDDCHNSSNRRGEIIWRCALHEIAREDRFHRSSATLLSTLNSLQIECKPILKESGYARVDYTNVLDAYIGFSFYLAIKESKRLEV